MILQIPESEADKFDQRVRECVEAAKGFASFTGFPAIGSAHLALGLLAASEGRFDPLFKELFSGLKSKTVFESLIDILNAEADIAAGEPQTAEPQMGEDARALMRRAETVAAEWNREQVTIEALAFALLKEPDQFVVEAFEDAGIRISGLEALADRLAQSGSEASAKETVAPVFQNGEINLEAFGPITQDALFMLAKIAASEPDRNLRDVDLIYCLTAQSDSLMIESLYVMGAPVRTIRSQIESFAGNPSIIASASALRAERMSRLLKGIFDKAREIALSERCSLVSESQLLRAHLNRVGETSNNIYQRLGINVAELRSYLASHTEERAKAETRKESRLIEDVEGYLLSRVLNQEPAIYTVLPSLASLRAELNEPGQLMGVFLFLGATGVGKTELARAIADVAFEARPDVKDPYLIRIDCGRFKRPDDIVQLLGAPQGLVGYKEGRLTNGLRDKPRSVILFDEAEKAHPSIWQSLLTFFDEGIVHEADGTEYDATGCILIATSNLGYKEAIEQFNLWQVTPEDQEKLVQEVEEFVWRHVRDYFSPEFLGRFGRENVIFFNHFSRHAYKAIIRRQINALCEEMSGRGFEVEFKEKVEDRIVDHLANLAWERREEGARPVRRLLRTHLRSRIVSALGAEPNRKMFRFTFLEGSGQVALEN